MPKKQNLIDILDICNKVHKNKYNYDKVIFTKTNNKIIINCIKHGDFEQICSKHMLGQGCPKCGNENRNINKKINTNIFVLKSNNIHNNFYNYSKTKYIGALKKVIIICPVHGEFEQIASNHLEGKGCFKCRNIKISKIKTKPIEQYLDLLNECKLTNNLNEFHLVNKEHINMKSLLNVICKEHGEYTQSISNYLKCYRCRNCVNNCKYSVDEFIDCAVKKHGEKYNYSKVVYINIKTKVEIICDKHGSFFICPNNHLNGNGCQRCRESKGESKIRQYLEIKNIKFDTNISMSKLFTNFDKYSKYLSYDFRIGDILIEFDGEQHFKPFYFDKNDDFEKRKNNDKTKDDFIINEKYFVLHRIKYTSMKRLEKILDDIFSNHNYILGNVYLH